MNSMICPKCGNLISYNSYFGAYYCSVCGEYFQEIKKTNADKIRAMSDKELAELMRSMMDYDSCGKMFSFKCDGSYEHCSSVCLKWLQMPAEGDDHA